MRGHRWNVSSDPINLEAKNYDGLAGTTRLFVHRSNKIGQMDTRVLFR